MYDVISLIWDVSKLIRWFICLMIPQSWRISTIIYALPYLAFLGNYTARVSIQQHGTANVWPWLNRLEHSAWIRRLGVQVPLRSKHFLSQKLWHFPKNNRSCVENECCCTRTVNISNVNFTSKTSISFSVSVSIYLSLCLCHCLCLDLSITLDISFSLSPSLSLPLFISLSGSLDYIYIYIFVCVCVCVSVCILPTLFLKWPLFQPGSSGFLENNSDSKTYYFRASFAAAKL